MPSKFYVNVDALNNYSNYLKKWIRKEDAQITYLSKANSKFQYLLHDSICEQVNSLILQFKNNISKLNIEFEKMQKEVNKDYELYKVYLKKL